MYDLAVVGLGTAGVEAVRIALNNNLNVIAFEKENLGGTCLNKGCIPTKSVLYCADIYSKIKKIKNTGISVENPSFNWQEILKRKNSIVSKFNNALNLAFSKKVKMINSSAELKVADNNIVIVSNGIEFRAKNIIIATGSRPCELPDLKFDHNFILNSDDMFELENIPKSMAIIGSGAIGLEWAEILSSFGCKTYLIEKAQSLAPNMDIDIQRRLDRILKTKNIKFYKNDFVISYKNNILKLNSKTEILIEKVLVATGRKKVLPYGFDEKLLNFDNVFLAGDCCEGIMLAHRASFQARKIMDKILYDKPIPNSLVPSVIYTTPQIASVGIKEQDIENINEYKIIKYMLPSLAKSWCDEAADGFVKVILKDDCLKGAHIVSKSAEELAAAFNILITKKMKKDEILDIIFPHPSYSEIISEILKNA